MRVLLQGIGGSVAHGLAGPGSDVDRYGVYVAPTLDLVVPWSAEVRESVQTSDPDVTLHEAGKFALLLAGCNPTAMEMLWLPSELYEVMTEDGHQLVDLRSDVLCAQAIRQKYAGMVREQVRRLSNPNIVAPDRKRNAAKLVRHGLRVAEQGMTLLQTGRLVVRPPDPERFRRYDEDPFDGVDELVQAQAALLAAPAPGVPEDRPVGALDGLRDWVRMIRLNNLP